MKQVFDAGETDSHLFYTYLIGVRLQFLRRRRCESVYAVARAVRMSPRTVRYAERQALRSKPSQLAKLCAHYGIALSDLLDGDPMHLILHTPGR